MTWASHHGVMDTITTRIHSPNGDLSPRAGEPARAQAESRLRSVLRANAAFSVVTGTVGAVAAGWVADRLGVAQAGWVRFVGVDLLLFAGVVLLVSRLGADRLRLGALLVSAGDLSWVAATVVILAVGAFSGAGPALAVVAGLIVLDLALMQLWFRSRMLS